MDEDSSLIDDFFLRKPITRKPSTTIPRRPKEQARSTKPSRLHPYSTSAPRSPICSNTTLRPNAYSPVRSISTSSPPPLPPPLEFSSPIRSLASTRLSTTVSPSIVPSSIRKPNLGSIPNSRKSVRKPLRQPPSPCIQIEPTSRVLVPDSTDSPPQELPYYPSEDIHQAHSDSDPQPERDFNEFYDDHDAVQQKLFNSSPSPPKFVSRHVNSSDKAKGKAREMDNCEEPKDVTDDEEDKRERLLAELAFEGEVEEVLPKDCVPFSSSPIEIIRPAKTTKLGEGVEAKASTSKDGDKWKKSAGCSSAKNTILDLSEWEDESTIHPIESGSSFHQEEEPRLLLASQEDQIKHIGVVIDDSGDEDGSLNSGIAPLMDSWPASKRGIFLKMAGLSSDDGPTDEADQAQAAEDWDLLLGKSAKKNASLAKKVVKKSWYNRSLFRAKKKGSKSFKAVGKSARRVK
ncbi:hypothetical protein PtA15_1A362 [Puccinia triticina]|uniref:Uncharacterized protein n=1 Tax=Puccinia triticina TaxID=208348 RepID=A0ABY7C8K3_9BASI|nr:uncharacterized protein PtA15_1A362 [Puccinia triticina]WAQ81024.1 hypothetical protein PtA15_1A362 [Puccinia triticina]